MAGSAGQGRPGATCITLSGAPGIPAHWDHRVDDDHYQQPGDLFRKMNAAQRQALFDNTARAVGGAAVHIQERHIANCAKADPEYGAGVAAALVCLAGGNLATDDRQSARCLKKEKNDACS